MMYSEFVRGTGCKDNAHNYKVFQDLELMYMNSDLTKDVIYEYGKKLVDNSKSSDEIELENRVKAEIEEQKKYIGRCKRELAYYKDMLKVSKETGNAALAYLNKGSIKYYQDQIKEARSKNHRFELDFGIINKKLSYRLYGEKGLHYVTYLEL